MVCADLHDQQIAFVAIQECRWEKQKVAEKIAGYVWYGGGAWKNTSGACVGGTAIGVHSSIAKAIVKHEHRNGRIQLVQIKGEYGKNITFASLYGPTEYASKEIKQAFWRDLRDALKSIGHKRKDVLILGMDANGETGRSDHSLESPIGPWGGGSQNDNGKRLVEICQLEEWFVAATFINRPTKKKWTFAGEFAVHGDKRRRREYDHLVCSNNLRGRIEDVVNVRNTRHDSDHSLRCIIIRLRKQIAVPKKKPRKLTNPLRMKSIGRHVDEMIKNRFAALLEDEEDEMMIMNVEEKQQTQQKITEQMVGQLKEKGEGVRRRQKRKKEEKQVKTKQQGKNIRIKERRQRRKEEKKQRDRQSKGNSEKKKKKNGPKMEGKQEEKEQSEDITEDNQAENDEEREKERQEKQHMEERIEEEPEQERETKQSVSTLWNVLTSKIYKIAEEVPPEERIPDPWISEETLELVQERTELRIEANASEKPIKGARKKLKNLRKDIKKAIRRDRKQYYEDLAAEAEKASNIGDQKEVYRIIGQLKGGRVGAVDLKGVDIPSWVDFFKNLLGTSNVEIPEDIKKKNAWIKAGEWLDTKGRYAKTWDIPVGPPTDGEVMQAVRTCKNHKGVNRDQIPAELWKNSPNATKLLAKMVRTVWRQIQQNKTVDIPEDWVNATLVCLYKGKGSRKDPSKHRGISLICLVEKIVSNIILKRIAEPVDERLMQGQNGFRPLKSCRDAVFRLWREIEKMNKDNEAAILTFIDYSKAFDSLEWEKLWKIIEFAGCPEELVAIIRNFYQCSTISIRITRDGELAPEFQQKRGIRQGSSLSPCLFVIAMDFCLRVFQDSCEELGLPSHDQTWIAYADDLKDKSLNEGEASQALQELEAASAFVGLRLNVPKTEVMAKGIKIPESVRKPGEPPVKQRVSVTYTNGKFEGWMTRANWAHLIGIDDLTMEEKDFLKTAELENAMSIGDEKEEKKGEEGRNKRNEKKKKKCRGRKKAGVPVVIAFDDDTRIVATAKGGGWMTDADGDAHRIVIAYDQVIQPNKSTGWACQECESCFDTEIGLKAHRKRQGTCRKVDSMTFEQLKRLRRTRQQSAWKRGKSERKVEMVSVRTCENLLCKPCGSFVYLGSMLDMTASATPEIRRRVSKAFTAFGSLNNVWKSRTISRTTKATLYKALILTIMLYNAEVWPLNERDLQALEATHFRMMRRMVTTNEDAEHISRDELHSMFKMPTIREYIGSKRLRWVGHALRRGEHDESRRAVLAALEDTSALWTKWVMEDCKGRNIRFRRLETLVLDRNSWRKTTIARMSHSG